MKCILLFTGKYLYANFKAVCVLLNPSIVLKLNNLFFSYGIVVFHSTKAYYLILYCELE